MSDHLDSVDEPSATEVAAIERLLASHDIWHDPPEGVEDAVVTAIVTAAGASSRSVAPVRLDARRSRHGPTWWFGAAAAVIAIVVGAALLVRDSDDTAEAGTLIELAGTDDALDASATARITSTPAGLKIVLDTDGLAGAPPGSFYEAWVSDGTLLFSAGTFHLRGGAGPIALWSGVDDPAFRRLSITLEPVDGDTSSSGRAVLIGDFSRHDD